MQFSKLITKLNPLTLSEMVEWSVVVLLRLVVMSGSEGDKFFGHFSAVAGPQPVQQGPEQAVVSLNCRQRRRHKCSSRDPHMLSLPSEKKQWKNVSKWHWKTCFISAVALRWTWRENVLSSAIISWLFCLFVFNERSYLSLSFCPHIPFSGPTQLLKIGGQIILLLTI